MKSILMILLSVLAHPVFAADFPKNIFVAYDEERNLKLSAELPVDLNEPGTITVSKMNVSDPETILFNASVANAPVDANQEFPQLSIQLGRSGAIELIHNPDGSCTVRSTMREFFYPRPTRLAICSYFYAVGTRPGMSGSN